MKNNINNEMPEIVRDFLNFFQSLDGRIIQPHDLCMFIYLMRKQANSSEKQVIDKVGEDIYKKMMISINQSFNNKSSSFKIKANA